jgi:hypothetical protein
MAGSLQPSSTPMDNPRHMGLPAWRLGLGWSPAGCLHSGHFKVHDIDDTLKKESRDTLKVLLSSNLTVLLTLGESEPIFFMDSRTVF